MLDTEIPILTPYGNEYLIGFSATNREVIPSHIDIPLPVVSVSLKSVKHDHINSWSHIFPMLEVCRDYLFTNDSILHYFCDTTDIERAERNRCYSPQEYRHKLFHKYFQRCGFEDLYKRSLKFPYDGEYQFMSLISRNRNSHYVDLLHDSAEELSTK